MAITDNLVSHIYAESGDSLPTDKVQSLTLSGTGTATLTTVGGEDAWNLVTGDLSVSVPSFSYVPTTSTPGAGYSIAFRYRINTFGNTGTFNELLEVGEQRITKNGAGLRSRYQAQQTVGLTGCETTATVLTVVQVVRPARDSNDSDYTEVWKNQASRGTNDPDFIAGPSTNAAKTISSIQVTAPDTMNIDILDIAYWDRELTDAEAAAVADDLRAELPVGGDSGTTVNATLTAIDVTTYPATVTAAQIISSTLGVVSVGVYAATITTTQPTIVNASLPTISVTAFSAAITSAATITTEPLKNNTGTILASIGSIIANVYDLSTGALVVRKTGLTSSMGGVVTFGDLSLVATTEYLVVITIATADGVARITAE